MKLYMIRHGQTDWNVAHRIQGAQDIPLNDTGRAQAARLAGTMSTLPLTNIFTSPQRRAYATAEAIARGRKIPIISIPQLMEISYGTWEGRTTDDIFTNERQLYEQWWEHPDIVAPPGGETLGEVKRRCRQAWQKIKTGTRGDAAVVSHGGTLAYFIGLLLDDLELAQGLSAKNASITTLEYDPETDRCRLLRLNDDSHLP